MYKLVVVDDEEGIRTGVSNYFPWASIGIEVEAVCQDGIEALEVLSRAKIDFVLCDVRMPQMDGIRFAEIVRDRRYPCRIVFISAHKDFEYARRAIELGVTHYIVKPAGYEELREVFVRLIGELRERESGGSVGSEGGLEEAKLREEDSLAARIALLVARNLRGAKLTSIASELGLSANHFSFRFHQETGITFSQFLLDARMERAAQLLRRPGARVYEVSAEVGYLNSKSFIRAFKAKYGISPGKLSKESG
ncbi:MAG TPA: response regulator [Spirochaetia bacterium]|nr:response regulator [Spirochaetia bacterium]